MIDVNKTLSNEHITKIAGLNKEKRSIFEKNVFSFKLLEQLDKLLNHTSYCFKGGTSLLLLFKTSTRFSIDVDISLPDKEYNNRQNLEQLFKSRIKLPFTKVVEDKHPRKHGGRPIKSQHFKFFYTSPTDGKTKDILLDIVYVDYENQSANIDVKNSIFCFNEPFLTVNTIRVDDLFVDKLVAFAPNTIGVKYDSKNENNRPKGCEIIKQLFDTAFLSNQISNIDQILNTYITVSNFQIKLESKKKLNSALCLADTIKTCLFILSDGKSGEKNNYQIVMNGLVSFNNYKIGQDFSPVDMKRSAFDILLISSELYKRINPAVKTINFCDFEIANCIKFKELFYIDAKKIEKYKSNFLFDFK